jgi:hypothetical protein
MTMIGIAMSYGLDGRGIGVRFSAAAREFSLGGPTKLSTQWVPGNLSPRVKRPGREADHSAPSGAKVKNSEAILHSSMRFYSLEP